MEPEGQMTIYIFEPLMEDGKPVLGRGGGEEENWVDMGFPYQTTTIGKYPILTMQKFDSDPMGDIREVYDDFKNKMQEPIDPALFYNRMWLFWDAISETMAILEGKK
jgi:hypothetical protein